MSNHNRVQPRGVTFEYWLTKYETLKEGFISVYDEEPFDPDQNSSAYEIGRQMAIVAKQRGYKTKGALIRRQANSTKFAWVKTKRPELENIARSLGYAASSLTMR